MNWENVLNCDETQGAYNYFNESLMGAYNANFPVNTNQHSTFKKPKKHWITKGLLVS
jgi:hypothetical protein